MIAAELLVDDRLAPVVAVEVLDPLEVADRHAAGVAQDVGDHEHAVAERGSTSASGVVGPLAASAISRALIRPALRSVIWFSRAAGMRMSQSTSRTSALRDVGRAGEALDRAVLALPGDDLGDVEAGRACGCHRSSRRRRRPSSPRREMSRAAIEPALPKPWTATRRSWQVHAQVARRLDDRVDAAAGRRLVAALRAAEADRLAGDDARDRVADVHRVGVHHPGHDLGVGVDVRRRDVLLGADEDLDLGGEAAGQALELLLARASWGRR